VIVRPLFRVAHCFRDPAHNSTGFHTSACIVQVKRTRPKSFHLKYQGSVPLKQVSQLSQLTEAQGVFGVLCLCAYIEHHNALSGLECINEATAKLKKSKHDAVKAVLTVSAVGVRITDGDGEVTLENDAIASVCYCAITPSDKKRVAYIANYSKLGER
jgi:transcriptional regulator with PAS, ATPase and Fis domain